MEWGRASDKLNCVAADHVSIKESYWYELAALRRHFGNPEIALAWLGNLSKQGGSRGVRTGGGRNAFATESSYFLAALEADWHDLTDVVKPDLTMLDAGDPDAWARVAPGIPWLADHPLGWQSFEVLDDLMLAVQGTDLMPGAESLLEPLLARAHALLHLVLDRNAAGDCRLPWEFLENRPALRMAVALYYLRRDQQRGDDALALAHWLVTKLNPSDNHGLREELVRLLLERGDAKGALEICGRYPDDAMAGTLFNRPLALFLLGRHVEAEHALREAMAMRPHLLPMLLAAEAKAPRTEGQFVRVGGKEEAWIYREDHRVLWANSGALTWARGVGAPKARLRR